MFGVLVTYKRLVGARVCHMIVEAFSMQGTTSSSSSAGSEERMPHGATRVHDYVPTAELGSIQ